MGHIFEIEQGQFGLAVVDTAASGYSDSWQAPAGKTVDAVTLADYNPSSGAWTCQINSGALNATPDNTTKDVAPTWCEAGETIPTPKKTAFDFAVTFLQDPDVSTGLNAYLFAHDTEEAYIFAGFDSTNPPKMIGRVRLASGTIGGDARATLSSTLTLPLVRKPDIQFGDATTSIIVVGEPPTVTKGAAKPGDVFPAETTVTASDSTNAAKLAGLGYVASPTTAWTTGQKIMVGAYAFNWSGTAWAAGAHA